MLMERRADVAVKFLRRPATLEEGQAMVEAALAVVVGGGKRAAILRTRLDERLSVRMLAEMYQCRRSTVRRILKTYAAIIKAYRQMLISEYGRMEAKPRTSQTGEARTW
jgi:hypothetical protein